MEKTKLDILYETPTFFQKVIIYSNYELRMLLWRFLDLIDCTKSKSTKSFLLNKCSKEQWDENGFLHLKSFFSEEYIDEINASIDKSREVFESNRKVKNLKCGRIANIHASNRDVFKLLNDPNLREVQKQLLDGDPILWGSLTFKVGSQQLAHADAPWFYVEPYGSMIGIWIALEDIKPEAGPLFYIPKSHLDQLKVKDVLDKNVQLKEKVENFRLLNVSASSRQYWDLSKSVGDVYAKEWESVDGAVTVCPKKGDVFVWHQWLIHGGSPITNPALSRNSIVSHWVSDACSAFDQHNFFLNYDRLNSEFKQNLQIKKSRRGKFLRQYRTQVLGWD